MASLQHVTRFTPSLLRMMGTQLSQSLSIRCVSPMVLRLQQRTFFSSSSGKEEDNTTTSSNDTVNASSTDAECADKEGTEVKEDLESILLKNQVADLTTKLDEKHEKYLRAIAEVENIRKRSIIAKQEATQFGIQKFGRDFLEIADTMKLALDATPKETVKDNKDAEIIRDGMVNISSMIESIFKRHGIEQFDPVNEDFDANFHEAQFTIPDEGPSNKVKVVTKVGYKLNGRLLRPAAVGVTSPLPSA